MKRRFARSTRMKLCSSFCVFVALLPAVYSVASSLKRVKRGGGEAVHDICDNGKYLVEKEMGGEDNWRCSGERFSILHYNEPAGISHCSNKTREPSFRCMSEDIEYKEQPPSSGDYRPMAPEYGDYHYLPPQRWLHALQRGAVAFLYHPCTPVEQVDALKSLARSCLWRHIVTPYPHLTVEQPLALVSWGCVYRMSWVDVPEAKLWIRQHALRTTHSKIASDGRYNEGILTSAAIVSTPSDDVLCPDGDHTPAPTTGETDPHHIPTEPDELTESVEPSGPMKATASHSTSPCKAGTVPTQDSGVSCPTQIIVHAVLVNSHTGLVVLLVVAVLIVLMALLLVAWKLCRVLIKRRKKRARYKSVSKFFPFSYGRGEEEEVVTIPEMGPPKGMAAEREKLLKESDEDEF